MASPLELYLPYTCPIVPVHATGNSPQLPNGAPQGSAKMGAAELGSLRPLQCVRTGAPDRSDASRRCTSGFGPSM